MSIATRLATATMLSLALASAPVSARSYRGYHGGHGGYHHYHRGGGIGVGGALLGAAIIGGIAVAASNNNRDRGATVYDDTPRYADDDRYNGPEVYGEGIDPQSAEAGPVEDCSRAVEREAQSRGGLARVTGIDRVDPIEGGANVLGTLEINRGGDYAPQRLGWSCRAAYGQVTGVRLG